MQDEPVEPVIQPPTSRYWLFPALLLLTAAIAIQIYFAISPRVIRQSTNDGLLIRIDPATLPLEIAAIFAATACAVPLLIFARNRARQAAGAMLTVSLIFAIVTWHHHSALLLIRPTDFTAPMRGQLLPGDPVTIPFNSLRIIRFVGFSKEGARGKSYIHCDIKGQKPIELDLGPLSTEAQEDLETAARQAGVPVEYWD